MSENVLSYLRELHSHVPLQTSKLVVDGCDGLATVLRVIALVSGCISAIAAVLYVPMLHLLLALQLSINTC